VSPILEHEHEFVQVCYIDQMYLTEDQKKALGVNPGIDYYTAETCNLRGCTATKLDSSEKPLQESEKPLVDLDAYKLSNTGEI
jgi:hypothetical protein